MNKDLDDIIGKYLEEKLSLEDKLRMVKQFEADPSLASEVNEIEISNQFESYLNGELSTEERKAIEDRLNIDPGFRLKFEKYKAVDFILEVGRELYYQEQILDSINDGVGNKWSSFFRKKLPWCLLSLFIILFLIWIIVSKIPSAREELPLLPLKKLQLLKSVNETEKELLLPIPAINRPQETVKESIEVLKLPIIEQRVRLNENNGKDSTVALKIPKSIINYQEDLEAMSNRKDLSGFLGTTWVDHLVRKEYQKAQNMLEDFFGTRSIQKYPREAYYLGILYLHWEQNLDEAIRYLSGANETISKKPVYYRAYADCVQYLTKALEVRKAPGDEKQALLLYLKHYPNLSRYIRLYHLPSTLGD